MYRSTDGGQTWMHLGLDDASRSPSSRWTRTIRTACTPPCSAIPSGPARSAASIARSDGGATWQQVLHGDQDTGASFVRIDPFDANRCTRACGTSGPVPWEDKNAYNGTNGGLFKSTDGGEHWRQLQEGLPADLSQIDMAMAPSTRERLYATVATSDEGEYGSGAGLGVYRSDDGGENWHVATTDPRPAMRIGGGDLPILHVDPKTPTSCSVLPSSRTGRPTAGRPGRRSGAPGWR